MTECVFGYELDLPAELLCEGCLDFKEVETQGRALRRWSKRDEEIHIAGSGLLASSIRSEDGYPGSIRLQDRKHDVAKLLDSSHHGVCDSAFADKA